MHSETFDFVIVGAGTAGCVLANRLTEKNFSVLLLEAGGRDTNPWIHIPVGYFKTMHHPDTDWCYRTQPDPGLNGRSISWPRGKVLGGSSSINGLIYIRGQFQDYDDWEKMGNSGWSYKDLLPYFIKCEDQERGTNEFHGTGGNIAVSNMRIRSPISEAFIQGALECDIPNNDDFNGIQQEGAGYYQLTAFKGRRCSSAVGYLKPIKKRQNLKIQTNSHAIRILFDGSRASGIKYRRKDSTQVVYALRSVILSAGALGSPQLLMLSGIGNAEFLRDFQIPVRKHLPGVGENLQDHLQIRLVYRCKVPTLNDEIRNPLRRMMIGLRYLAFRTGPMSMAASQIGIFTKTSPELERPDIQFHFQPLSSDSPGKGVNDFSGITSSVTQLRPTSRGRLRLTSKDARDHISIIPNYLSTALDQKVAVAGIDVSRRIMKRPSMANLIDQEILPGENVRSFEEKLHSARNIGETIYHPVGTCKMGLGSDPLAVVDSRLRVHGIQGLRVVDASIMPTITSGNTNAPTFAIAEKASDMILQDTRI